MESQERSDRASPMSPLWGFPYTYSPPDRARRAIPPKPNDKPQDSGLLSRSQVAGYRVPDRDSVAGISVLPTSAVASME
ncbi:MAG: hypothetical protein AAFY20_15090 [Cyanobacteria bacterium J06639_14]